MCQEDRLPRVSVSLGRKINMGNYESLDVHVSLSGFTAETTEEEMEAAIANGRVGYNLVVGEINRRVRAIRGREEGNGEETPS
jgi:hypothetical protein